MLLHCTYFGEFVSTFYVNTEYWPFVSFLRNFYRLVEAHVFSFVIGRAFVTDVEKLRIHSKGRALHVADVIGFFSEITEVCSCSLNGAISGFHVAIPSLITFFFPQIQLGICPGSNLLYAVEVLVTEVSAIAIM